MKYLFLSFILLLCFTQSRAQYYDQVVNKLHSTSDLKTDVDFVRDKLESNLFSTYRYISKTQLDSKFDSLKQTITQPLTSIAFSAKLATVLSLIGDGHLFAYVSYAKLTQADYNAHANDKISAIYLFDYHIIGNRLYILQNYTTDKSIKPGSEIVSIDGVPSAKIVDTIDKHVSADGFNTTFKHFLLNKYSVAKNYRNVYGYQDSATLKIISQGVLRSVKIKATKYADFVNKTDDQAAQLPKVTVKMLSADSSSAYIKIPSFDDSASIVNTYADFFKRIKKANTKTLVLDLRGNQGGAANLAINLLSYLIDTPTYFYERPYEVMKGYNVFTKKTRIRTEQVAFYMNQPKNAYIKPNENGFKGKLYVLINGGTFSSASMVASHLQALNKAIFIGEETGGNSTYTSAGRFIDDTLPTSLVDLHYPIFPLTLPLKGKVYGHGVMPDVAISYTIDDYLANKNLEMDWVMKNIGII